MEIDHIVRFPAALEMAGISKSTAYRLIQVGEFPRQVKIGKRAVGLSYNRLQEWIHSRLGDAKHGTGREFMHDSHRLLVKAEGK